MKLNCTTGSFELLIRGYGRTGTNWWERNSLTCELLTESKQALHKQLAHLQTWEVTRLIDGLQQLWSRAANRLTLTFAEPGLSVDATTLPNETYRLQIQLDHALKPSWHPYPDFPLQLNSTVTRQQLREAIQDLVNQLACFPER